MKLTDAKKFAIAADYLAGLSVPAICAKHGITAGGIRRLRREDPVYQETEAALLDDLLEQSRVVLRNTA